MSDEYKIEKGIPMPPRKRLANILRALEIGDSFILKADIDRAMLSPTAKRLGIKVTSSITPDGIRVWRIK